MLSAEERAIRSSGTSGHPEGTGRAAGLSDIKETRHLANGGRTGDKGRGSHDLVRTAPVQRQRRQRTGASSRSSLDIDVLKLKLTSVYAAGYLYEIPIRRERKY